MKAIKKNLETQFFPVCEWIQNWQYRPLYQSTSYNLEGQLTWHGNSSESILIYIALLSLQTATKAV